MYIVEPFLNLFYRTAMRSVLSFDAVDALALPRQQKGSADDCLLYVHIPFCESLCPYCSFHRFVYDPSRADAYFRALRTELTLYRDLGYDFRGMYIGGGTPTMQMDRLCELLSFARERFGIREISVETNPNHLTEDNLTALKKAGVHRLSVGVQSFDDAVLHKIGRLEKYGSGAQIKEKLRQAQGLFDTLNVDLIFNMPVQSRNSIARDLDSIDELLPDQVTFYPLMTAPSVEASLRKSLGAISYRKEKDLYFLILDRMKKHYTGSTAWCFSRKKSMIDEYIITYNHYVGAGSGAFGYFNDRIYINTFNLDEYIEKLGAHQLPVTRVKKFTDRETRYYFFLMKLFGLCLSRAEFAQVFGSDYKKALRLEALFLKFAGALRELPDTVELTDTGKYYWVMAMREFFIAVDTMRDVCRDF